MTLLFAAKLLENCGQTGTTQRCLIIDYDLFVTALTTIFRRQLLPDNGV